MLLYSFNRFVKQTFLYTGAIEMYRGRHMRKNVCYRGAGILFVALMLILSASLVTANTIKINATTTKTPRPIPQSGTEAGLLEEGFEDGVMPPPGGWYTIDENTNRAWTIVDKQTNPTFIHSGTYAGWINYDSEFASDNWLVSPDIDLSGETNVHLSFWAESDCNWPGATMEVHIRGDGVDDTLWDLIADETWDEFVYHEVAIDLSNYIGQVINISWRYVGFDGQSFGLDDIYVGEPRIPDLDCEAELNWSDVEPGSNVTGEILVENVGDEGSWLAWEIESYPEWGTWTLTPMNGTDVRPEDGQVTIDVLVSAPDEKNTEYTGEVKIVNQNDPDDYCIVTVSLVTPRNKQIYRASILERLVQRFPVFERFLSI